METNYLLNLFGHSIFHPEVDQALDNFGASCMDKSKLEKYDSIFSKTLGITFTFWFKEFYYQNVDKPKSTYRTSNENEVVLYEITFNKTNNSSLTLPYGINYGDTPDIITKKLGVKPYSKVKNLDNQLIWTYYNDKFENMAAFDKDLHLIWLRILSLNKYLKKAIEQKINLKEQNRNITLDHIAEIIELKEKKPTKNWRLRLKEGDTIFNDNNILESENLLDSFIDNLVIATNTKKASSIYLTVKKVTINFNKVNNRHNQFIETTEREELFEFIENAIKLTGLKNDIGDITEEWRQW
jgi:hypothetical protein